MKRLQLIIIVLTSIFFSCTNSSNKQGENTEKTDSVTIVKEQLENEINHYFATIEEIERDLDKVKEIEGFISVQAVGENIDTDARLKIKQKINLISEILQKNGLEIDSLKRKLANSSFNIKKIEHSLDRLAVKLSEQMEHIENMQFELNKKDALISERDITIKGLASNIESLEEESKKKNQIIEKQEQTIYTAWYVFGTLKELKKQKIITNDGFFSNPRILEEAFNKDYFIKIDMRQTTKIPLYSKKAKIRTNHPIKSYSLEKENDLYVLKIIHPKDFWEISNYLVIEVE